MELRKLKGKDIFAVSKIVKKLNIDFNSIKISKDGMATGIAIAKVIFENIHLAEKELNDLLANLSGETVKVIEELDLEIYLDLVKQLKEQKIFIDFFKSAEK